jgi:hypothetical protein
MWGVHKVRGQLAIMLELLDLHHAVSALFQCGAIWPMAANHLLLLLCCIGLLQYVGPAIL